MSKLCSDEAELAQGRIAKSEAEFAFDLARGPLVRFTLLARSVRRHVLLVSMHHVISDGWSVRLMLRELAHFYGCAVRGEPHGLPPLPIHYADYASWQTRRVEGARMMAEEHFWLSQLDGAPLTLECPTASGTRQRSFRAACEVSRLRLDEVDALRRSASKSLPTPSTVTRFTALLSAFLVVLHRMTGALDIVVGTAVAGRVRPELEALIGFFVNVLPLRVSLRQNPSFTTIVARTQETVLQALAHQEYPFDLVVERLRPPRTPDSLPLVNVLFAYHNFGAEHYEVEGLDLERIRCHYGGAKYDLALLAVENEEDAETLSLELWYDVALFEPQQVRRWLAEFCMLVCCVGRHLQLRLMALDPLFEPSAASGCIT